MHHHIESSKRKSVVDTHSESRLLIILSSTFSPMLRITRCPILPVGSANWTGLSRTVQPSGYALQMKGMATLAKDYRTFISRILDPRSYSFKSRLTDTTDFIFTSSVPGPLGNSMKALDPYTELRFGSSVGLASGIGSRLRGNHCRIALTFSRCHAGVNEETEVLLVSGEIGVDE